MSLILGIDTALGQSSVAICRDGAPLAHFATTSRDHQAAHLLQWVEQCLADARLDYAELDAIATTTGPGGFTGIRVGLAAARAIGFAARKPVLGFSTLHVMAHTALAPERPTMTIIPAGRGMVFAQTFQHAAPISQATMQTLDSHPLGDMTNIIVTTAELRTQTQERSPHAHIKLHDSTHNAEILCALAQLHAHQPDAHPPVPLYIRPPDAKPQAKLFG
jgi:tRNA threonylcarbamoyladenosine biosynthesis protein TsaB